MAAPRSRKVRKSRNYALACAFLQEQGYMHRMLSRSRFNWRVHRIKDRFLTLFAVLGEHWKAVNTESVYLIDSFPVASCDNIRIARSQRYQGEAYRGYIASKRRYFYGLRVHLVVTVTGAPVEFFLVPGADNDTGALQTYLRELARKAIETTNSLITRRFPKTIHAVTAGGFELKIVLFLLAQSIDGLVR